MRMNRLLFAFAASPKSIRPSIIAASSASSDTITTMGRLSIVSRSSLVHNNNRPQPQTQTWFARSFSSIKGGGGGASASGDFYTVGITGSSGMVGGALMDELRGRQLVNGKPVRIVRLIRGETAEATPTTRGSSIGNDDQTTTTTSSLVWNPHGTSSDDVLHPDAAAEMDAIVHLAGENVGTGMGPLGFLGIRPWTRTKMDEILNSRVNPTKALSNVVAESPQPKTFLVASGVGVYGNKFIGDALPPADESFDVTNTGGFLAQISREWEAATETATNNSNNKHHRVVNMRFAVAMSRKGGALQKLYPVFYFGGGGVIGGGDQYFTFISGRDLARAIVHCLETPSLKGPVNMCAPHPCTNAEFTKALGEVMKRPTVLPFPGFAVSLLFGQMGEEMLLGGVRAIPKKLMESGFKFQHPTIKEALSSAIKEDI